MGIEKNDDYKQVWIKKKDEKIIFFLFILLNLFNLAIWEGTNTHLRRARIKKK